MIEPSVRVSIDALLRVLRSAGVPSEQLRAVLLVGGSSRIPLVGQLVGQTLRVPVAVDAHPKHSIALGAAITAFHRATGGDGVRPTHTNPMSPANLPAPPGPPGPPIRGGPPPAGAAPVKRRRWLPIAAAVAVLVIGGTTAVLLTRGGPGGEAATTTTSAAASGTSPSPSPSLSPSAVRGLPKSAAPLPDTELAFASRQNDNMDVWTMVGSDGSNKKRLVNVPGVDDYLPAISPDRRSVAYIRIRGLQSELHVVAADGTGDIALTTQLAPDARPSWSPDGTTLVFASAIDGQTDLYTASFEFSDKPPRLGPLTRPGRRTAPGSCTGRTHPACRTGRPPHRCHQHHVPSGGRREPLIARPDETLVRAVLEDDQPVVDPIGQRTESVPEPTVTTGVIEDENRDLGAGVGEHRFQAAHGVVVGVVHRNNDDGRRCRGQRSRRGRDVGDSQHSHVAAPTRQT